MTGWCECKEVHVDPQGFICPWCADQLRAAITKAEAERDEARELALATFGPKLWYASSPVGCLRMKDGVRLWSRAMVGELCTFGSEAEAREAGRALPWWEANL